MIYVEMIDREKKRVIVEKDNSRVTIPLDMIHGKVKRGDVLVEDGDGYVVDVFETMARKEYISHLMLQASKGGKTS